MVNYKKKFKAKLAQVYTDEELDVLFKLVIADIKHQEFNRVSLNDISLNTGEEAVFQDFINQLTAKKPIQHILGKADFYGLHFKVSPAVLIPRPETEELVHLIISEYKNKTVDILDIGTGSGCIAISLKHNLPKANVSALDISLDALAIAKQNVEKHETNITFYNDDALDLIAIHYPEYDVIVSNPPYIAEKEKADMDNLVVDNEPHLALFVADNEALIFYDRITDFAITNLKPSGTLYFEINQNIAQETRELIEKKGFKVELIKDLNANFRMIKAQFRETNSIDNS
ncbi:MAG TPA: peptide chain release factor N(5)-glutamine methyltransferase [Pelobium sp.]|nr:peptide chain release factor N(5)-glutamine methyltransferase [Pelobium sp.]